MALLVYNSAFGGSGVAVSLGTTDSVLLGSAAMVYSTNDHAITGGGSGTTVTVHGVVHSVVADGIHLAGADSANASVVISAGGSVRGADDGIEIRGDNSRVYNHGTIEARYGIYINSPTDNMNQVVNTGVIHSSNFSVYAGNGACRLINTGTIISSDSGSFFGSDVADIIKNSGQMVGDIFLSDGDDSYRGRHGIVEGWIRGEGGNDIFIVGAGSDSVSGGDGTDMLDFSAAGSVQVALDQSFANTGLAAGDDYVGIESINGSNNGNDRLGGDTGNNWLAGLGGADTLSGGGSFDEIYGGDGKDSISGGAANDSLNGGVGADVISGGSGNDRIEGGDGKDSLSAGAGNDIFIFNSLDDFGDKISDFHHTVSNHDQIYISGVGLGGGIPGGELAAAAFHSSTSNHAHDASDRFIFRTTDRTLWFDADGNGAGSAVLVADFQTGAAVSNTDIYIV